MVPEYLISPEDMDRLVESGEIAEMADDLIEEAKGLPDKLRPSTRNRIAILTNALGYVVRQTGALNIHLVAACLLAAYWAGVQAAQRSAMVLYVAEPTLPGEI